MILVSLFTYRWLIGGSRNGVANNIGFDKLLAVDDRISVGIFLKCVKPEGDLIFEGECIPSLTELEKQFLSKDDNVYPHAWKGGIGCFVLGLAIMVFTVLLALLTPCCRTCLCCSVFTFCGSVQMFAAVLFSLGLLAYPAGWRSRQVTDICGPSDAFILGNCHIGGAYWMAVAGTICTALASSLTVFAYKSTKSSKTTSRKQEGDKFICVP